MQLVQGVDAADMKSAYEEAKGDFYFEQGNAAAALTAYQAALASDESGDASVGALLRLKVDLVQPAAEE